MAKLLALIPSAYKLDKVASVLPMDGTGDFSLTRSTTATRVNSSGVIEEMAIDMPRIDHFAGGCPVLLLEVQGTNLMTTSEPTSTGAYKTGVVFQQTNIYSWNGIYYGDNSARRIAYFSSSTTVGVDVTFSVFIKMTNGNAPSVGTSSTDDFKMYISSATALGLQIIDFGGGVYRCSITKSATSTNSNIAIEKVTGNSANTFEVSGFQMEHKSDTSSYIPTNGTTVTRAADLGQVTTPTGVTSITETVSGVDTVITTIPTTYSLPIGRVETILME